MHFNIRQKQYLEDCYNTIRQKYPEEEKVTVAYAAEALSDICENINWEDAYAVCERICDGQAQFRHLFRDGRILTDTDFTQKMISHITANFTESQKKGFYLQWIDTIERETGCCSLKRSDIAKRAVLSEKEMEKECIVLIGTMKEKICFQLCDTTADTSLYVRYQDSGEKQKDFSENSSFLFAVAEYAACVNGIFPNYLAQYPELMGACAAGQILIKENWTQDAKLLYPDDQKQILDLIYHVILGVIGTAMVFAAGMEDDIVSDAIFELMEEGIWGITLGALIAISVWGLDSIGGILILYAADKARKRYGTNRQAVSENQKKEQIGTDKTEDQKQEEMDCMNKEVRV